MNKASARTMEWQRTHPEQWAKLKAESKQRKLEMQLDAIQAFKKSAFKSPMDAIRAYCRSSRCFDSSHQFYRSTPIRCQSTDCPLYAFRNLDGRRVVQGARGSLVCLGKQSRLVNVNIQSRGNSTP